MPYLTKVNLTDGVREFNDFVLTPFIPAREVLERYFAYADGKVSLARYFCWAVTPAEAEILQRLNVAAFLSYAELTRAELGLIRGSFRVAHFPQEYNVLLEAVEAAERLVVTWGWLTVWARTTDDRWEICWQVEARPAEIKTEANKDTEANLARFYGLSVEMVHRICMAYYLPGDPLAKAIQAGLAAEGKSSLALSDWLAYAGQHDLSQWVTGMSYQDFVAERAAKYGLSVEMTHRVGVAYWTPGDPLGEAIAEGLAAEGGGHSLADWLDYASRHDLSQWLEKGEATNG